MANAIEGQGILSADVPMPRVGVWHATVQSDADKALSGSVTFDIDSTTFKGVIARSDLNGGRVLSKVIGGAGKLATELEAKNYANGPTVSQVLEDILRECGETLAYGSDANILGTRLPKWHRASSKASTAITALLDPLGAIWRIQRDGTLWVGPDTFPELDVEHVILDEDWTDGTIEIAPTTADLLPGVTFLGHQISYVVHRLRPNGLRTEARLVDAPGNMLERLYSDLRRKIGQANLYPARVVSQNADGTLSLMPDDEAIKGRGLDRVPLRYGLPGFTATVPARTRVRVGFDAGDPSRPFASLWDAGAATTVTFNGGTRPFARAGDPVIVFFPQEPMAVSGTVDGLPFAGTILIATPGNGIIGGGNPQLLG